MNTHRLKHGLNQQRSDPKTEPVDVLRACERFCKCSCRYRIPGAVLYIGDPAEDTTLDNRLRQTGCLRRLSNRSREG